MNTIDYVCCNINCTLKAECYVGSPEVVVNCFRERNYVKPFFTEQVCGFLCAVAAENNKAVKVQLFVILLHSRNLVNAVFVNNTHKLERLS